MKASDTSQLVKQHLDTMRAKLVKQCVADLAPDARVDLASLCHCMEEALDTLNLPDDWYIAIARRTLGPTWHTDPAWLALSALREDNVPSRTLLQDVRLAADEDPDSPLAADAFARWHDASSRTNSAANTSYTRRAYYSRKP